MSFFIFSASSVDIDFPAATANFLFDTALDWDVVVLILCRYSKRQISNFLDSCVETTGIFVSTLDGLKGNIPDPANPLHILEFCFILIFDINSCSNCGKSHLLIVVEFWCVSNTLEKFLANIFSLA